ncbi:TraR/DksA C4-type zinc finger protein [Nocardia sp. NPDC050193]
MPLAQPISHARLSDHVPALRARLDRQRRFRVQQLAELDAEIDHATTPADAADRARHEVTLKLAAAARQALADIDETLTLITTGRYGRCRRCHTEIPIHLLQTIPTTQWCLNCRRHLPDHSLHRTHAIHDRIAAPAAPDPHRHAHNATDLVTAIIAGTESPIDAFDPVRLDTPALTVDTRNGYQPDLDTITRFAATPH